MREAEPIVSSDQPGNPTGPDPTMGNPDSGPAAQFPSEWTAPSTDQPPTSAAEAEESSESDSLAAWLQSLIGGGGGQQHPDSVVIQGPPFPFVPLLLIAAAIFVGWWAYNRFKKGAPQ